MSALPRDDGDENGGGATLGLVLTGGTVGAERHGATLSVAAQPTPAEAALLAAALPAHGAPRIVVAEPLRKLSENLAPRDWPVIAGAVRRLVELDGAAGVLVLHGTDTMPYTAAALAYLLADLAAPIVLTGSRLPAQQAGSDAPANVHAALLASQALAPGVYVVFGAGAEHPAHVHLGTRVRKQRAGAHSFVSVNRKLVAKVDGGRVEIVRAHAQRARERSRQEVDERVLVLRLHPGVDFAAARESVERGGVRAVVVELYASATGPDTDDRFSLPAFARACAAHGTLVVTTTPGAPGPPPPSTPDSYETAAAIAAAGAVSLGDMSTEAATVKAMWALVHSADARETAALMLEPIAGELTPGDPATR
jgi:L-asparaginase